MNVRGEDSSAIHSRRHAMKQMLSRCIAGGILSALTMTIGLHAQEFKIGSKEVQIHGFGTQGYILTNDNNWLTMNTSDHGSGAFTDMAFNMSMQATDRVRIAGQ